MATYKVIQDIEAEDKLLGPLTLRQFIYAAIVVVMGFIAFKLIPISPFFVIPFLPPMVFFGMLAAPFGHDQPSEVWMLAKFRFFLKPRRRIWNQDGMQELVTITVPKKIEKNLTNGLNQYEVKSRLQALASTLDSRGWAVKNVSVNLFSQPSYLADNVTDSDRLVDASSLPQEVPAYEVLAGDDIMDERSNPTAQHLDSMISQSEQSHREAVVTAMQDNHARPQTDAPPADYWFMNQPAQPPVVAPGYATFSASPVVLPGIDYSQNSAAAPSVPNEAEEELLEKIHTEKAKPLPSYGHMKTLQPLSGEVKSKVESRKSKVETEVPAASQSSAAASDDSQSDDDQPEDTAKQPANPAIMRLADNDDLNVATIAREAKKAEPKQLDDEVTISLR